jgi:pyruvate/2-oxoglutarate/acetoin dehydrogenase E1 component
MAITEPTYSRDMLWVINSGSSRYITYLREAFTKYRVLDTPIQVTTANGACIPAITEGTMLL